MFRRGIIFVLLLVSVFAIAETTKRLILKDGSYQAVTKYEVKGDRVRYLSAERYEWEEMPKDLIDWPATEKYEQQLKSGTVSKSAQEIDKEVEEEKKEEEARTPEIAPNLRLPITGGVYIKDVYRDQPQLVELNQSGSEINKNMKGNILRATINPFASAKQKIELTGAHAKVQLHVPRPVIFLSVESDEPAGGKKAKTKSADEPEQPEKPVEPEDVNVAIPPTLVNRFRVVRMEQKKDVRVVGNLKIAMTGSVSQQQTFVPTESTLMGGGWIKVTPSQDLAPGEYAVVEMLGEHEMNLFVWDFGVNPSAPENPTAWKPEEVKDQRPANEKPVLQQRQKDQ
jgi:hypothetical protein